MGYRRGHGRRGHGRIETTIQASHEFEVELKADVNLGYQPPPYRDHDDPNFSDPGDGGDVDDVRLALTREQIEAIRDEVGGNVHNGTRRSDEEIERIAFAVLKALDPKFPGDNDDEFFEKAGEIAEYRDEGDE